MSDLILVTGGAGTLGRAIAPALLAAGYAVRLVDTRPIEDGPVGVESVIGDLREAADVQSAMIGAAGVIHAAAWHGVHLRDHPRDDFWDLNVRGTYHVYEAAATAGVRAVVLSSTMGVYGDSRRPVEGGPATRINEDLPRRPGEIYGLSKVISEEMSGAYTRMAGIAGAALRYGMFVPEPFHHAGIRFLYGGVDERDVARANLLVLERLLRDGGHIGAFNVFSALPFRAEDGFELRSDPLAVVTRYWPDAPKLLAGAGVEPCDPIDEVYEIERAETVLGFRPEWGFAEFVEALRAGRTSL